MSSVYLKALASDMEHKVEQGWAENRPRFRPQSNYASQAAHVCPWFLWACREHWETRPAPDNRLLGIFKTGNEVEEAVLKDLAAAGYQVSHQQVAFEDRDLNIRGRIDGYLYSEELRGEVERILGKALGPRWPGVPMEIKSCSPTYFQDLTSFRAMLDGSRSWVKKYPGQVLLYAYMDEEPQPIVAMVLRDKSSRQTRILLELVDDFQDELVRIGENVAAVNVAIREGTEPEAISYCPSWCDGCDFETVCPTMLHLQGGGSISLETGPVAEELVSACQTMAENKPAQLAYNRADKARKALLEKTGHWPAVAGESDTVVSGPWRVTVKAGRRTSKVYPTECSCGAAIEPETVTKVSRKVEAQQLGE